MPLSTIIGIAIAKNMADNVRKALTYTLVGACVASSYGLLAQAATAESVTPAAPRVLSIACPMPVRGPLLLPLEHAFNQALAPQNLRARIIATPELRAFAQMRTGEIDGICGISSLLADQLTPEFGTLLTTPIADLNIIAVFNKRQLTTPPTLETIYSGDYKLGYSASATENYLKSQGINNAISISNLSLAQQLLDSGRLDVLIGIDVLLKGAVPENERHLYTSLPLQQQYSYPLLHNTHKAILPALNTKFKQLVDEHHGPISLKNYHHWTATPPSAP